MLNHSIGQTFAVFPSFFPEQSWNLTEIMVGVVNFVEAQGGGPSCLFLSAREPIPILLGLFFGVQSGI
jgi:hypothetical protein